MDLDAMAQAVVADHAHRGVRRAFLVPDPDRREVRLVAVADWPPPGHATLIRCTSPPGVPAIVILVVAEDLLLRAKSLQLPPGWGWTWTEVATPVGTPGTRTGLPRTV